MENNYKTDTQKTMKKVFLDRFIGVFVCSIFLTGLFSISGVYFLLYGLVGKAWTDIGVAGYVKQAIMYISVICTFVSLISIVFDKKPFSRTLTYGIRIISIVFIVGSILVPRLQGFKSSGFDIFATGEFVLIDGSIMLPGLLLFILSVLIHEGFYMQKEYDEIL